MSTGKDGLPVDNVLITWAYSVGKLVRKGDQLGLVRNSGNSEESGLVESFESALEARLNVFTRAVRRQLDATGTAADVKVALGRVGCYAGPL